MKKQSKVKENEDKVEKKIKPVKSKHLRVSRKIR